MAPQRLPLTRVAGIAAWTAASVTWGTAAVAVTNVAPPPEIPAGSTEPEAELVVEADVQEVLAPIPAMPESGLVVLRYTPSEKPEARVVVRQVVVSSPSPGGSSTPAKAPTKAPAKVKSSGS
ncbi:MAG: hypothetical protein M3112_01270 [Actinomycetia bacterium]|nr:hypothetical protein [Actinomycetes bacterium]